MLRHVARPASAASSRLFEPVRCFSLVPRSPRLPFHPGCFVSSMRLRGVRYSHVVSRRDFAVLRGPMAGEIVGSLAAADAFTG